MRPGGTRWTAWVGAKTQASCPAAAHLHHRQRLVRHFEQRRSVYQHAHVACDGLDGGWRAEVAGGAAELIGRCWAVEAGRACQLIDGSVARGEGAVGGRTDGEPRRCVVRCGDSTLPPCGHKCTHAVATAMPVHHHTAHAARPAHIWMAGSSTGGRLEPRGHSWP